MEQEIADLVQQIRCLKHRLTAINNLIRDKEIQRQELAGQLVEAYQQLMMLGVYTHPSCSC